MDPRTRNRPRGDTRGRPYDDSGFLDISTDLRPRDERAREAIAELLGEMLSISCNGDVYYAAGFYCERWNVAGLVDERARGVYDGLNFREGVRAFRRGVKVPFGNFTRVQRRRLQTAAWRVAAAAGFVDPMPCLCAALELEDFETFKPSRRRSR